LPIDLNRVTERVQKQSSREKLDSERTASLQEHMGGIKLFGKET